MLNASHPKTGESLDALNLRYQILTFLVARHETSSPRSTPAWQRNEPVSAGHAATPGPHGRRRASGSAGRCPRDGADLAGVGSTLVPVSGSRMGEANGAGARCVGSVP